MSDEAKIVRLAEPHVAPLARFVERMRAARAGASVPWFDPAGAGVEARILTLLQDPGPMATAELGGSGFVSADNHDPTAAAMLAAYAEAGVARRRELVSWNAVPWRVGGIQASDIRASVPWLRELVSGELPALRVVVLTGWVARDAWRELGSPGRPLDVLGLPPSEIPHPGRRNTRYTADEKRERIAAALAEARQLAGLALPARPQGAV